MPENFTIIELRILEMIVGNMTDNEIAFALDISENTVKTHFKNIFGKLGVFDKTDATDFAIKNGLMRIDV